MPKGHIRRTIRTSQLITPFGVGSIFTTPTGESFVIEDIDKWADSEGHFTGDEILLSRLANAYGLDGFRSPPLEPGDDPNFETQGRPDKKYSIPCRRFPRWLFCPDPNCGRMVLWTNKDELELNGSVPKCTEEACDSKPELSPVRFVSVCPNGHLQDVPWALWVHNQSAQNQRDPEKKAKQKGCKHDKKLRYKFGGSGGGSLFSVEISCDVCGASASLGDLSATKPPRWKCFGRQPGQPEEHGVECTSRDPERPDAVTKVMQRGASTVYDPMVVSAIDIPPAALWSSRSGDHPWKNSDDYEKIVSHARQDSEWETNPKIQKEIRYCAKKKKATTGKNEQELIQELIAIIKRELIDVQAQEEIIENAQDLRWGEFNAFINPPQSPDPRDNFIVSQEGIKEVDPRNFQDPEFAKSIIDKIDHIRCVQRIREVRALLAYSRAGSKSIPVASKSPHIKWRPAIELFGEGIFLAFNNDFVDAWEDLVIAKDKQFITRTERNYRQSPASDWPGMPEALTPRFIALHTLAHLLIRQLSFECGYGSSSLSECIYAATGEQAMCGLLIHTAENDCEGSMGGLVRQGQASRLLNSMILALDRARWCSNDPLCSENRNKGKDGLCGSACHACTFIAETSCRHSNLLLDRQLLLGPNGFMTLR